MSYFRLRSGTLYWLASELDHIFTKVSKKTICYFFYQHGKFSDTEILRHHPVLRVEPSSAYTLYSTLCLSTGYDTLGSCKGILWTLIAWHTLTNEVKYWIWSRSISSPNLCALWMWEIDHSSLSGTALMGPIAAEIGLIGQSRDRRDDRSQVPLRAVSLF